MSKKNNRRLSLKRETLRQLAPDQLADVVGGGKIRTAYCAATYTCGKPTEDCISCPCAE